MCVCSGRVAQGHESSGRDTWGGVRAGASAPTAAHSTVHLAASGVTCPSGAASNTTPHTPHITHRTAPLASSHLGMAGRRGAPTVRGHALPWHTNEPQHGHAPCLPVPQCPPTTCQASLSASSACLWWCTRGCLRTSWRGCLGGAGRRARLAQLCVYIWCGCMCGCDTGLRRVCATFQAHCVASGLRAVFGGPRSRPGCVCGGPCHAAVVRQAHGCFFWMCPPPSAPLCGCSSRRFHGMEYCDLKKDRTTAKSKGYCYVNYSTHEAAAAAVDQLNGMEFPPHTGHRIKVGQAWRVD